MAIREASRYVVLALDVNADGGWRWRGIDDKGVFTESRPGTTLLGDVYLPPWIQLAILDRLVQRPVFEGRLPLFLSLPAAHHGAYDPLRGSLIRFLPSFPIEVVELTRTAWVPRGPLRLPLYLIFSPASRNEALSLRAMLEWLPRSPTAEEHGLKVEAVDAHDWPQALADRPVDLVFVSGPELAGAEATCAVTPERARPRLMIVAGDPSASGAASPPPGMSLLWVEDEASVAAVLSELLLEIVHDRSLAEAVFRAREKTGAKLRLVSDPSAIEDLRLSKALAGLVGEVTALRTRVGDSASVAEFSQRLGEVPAALSTSLAKVDQLAPALAAVERRLLALNVTFDHEARGLLPMAGIAEELELQDSAVKEAEKALSDALAASPDWLALVRAAQNRRVDLRLERFTERLPIGLDEDARRLLVDERTILQRLAPYLLRTHVGNAMLAGLVRADIPPLDPLLVEPPDIAGYALEVVVFPLDFSIVGGGAVSQKITLPLVGPSPDVVFALRAPDRVGPARFRLTYYQGNHLLQSFLVTAEVGDAEQQAETPAVRAVLEFSRTTKFENLQRLGERALSIAVNESPARQHTFTIKRGDTSAHVDVEGSLINKLTESFREMLLRHTVDGDRPWFPAEPPDGYRIPDRAAAAVRELATFGSRALEALIVRGSKPLKDELCALTTVSDAVVQIVRHDPTFSFPWTVIYDRFLPEELKGQPQAPVCFGSVGGAACQHVDDERVYCVRGFWGGRLGIEQLVDAGGDAPVAAVATAQPSVKLATGVNVKPLYDHLRGKLHDANLARVEEVGPTRDLIEDLWDPSTRPSQLIVVAHLETRDLVDEPSGPRLQLNGARRWLQAEDVTRQERRARALEDPRPLLLLLACGSASTELTTLNDFVLAFSSAGVAAIVGTEGIVFDDLVCRFARELTMDIWTGAGVKLGVAVARFRRRLLSEGNPMAFMFTLFGDADLSFSSPGTAAHGL